MNTLRTSLFLALSAFALSCGGSPNPDTTPRPDHPPTGSQVDLAIASVTLADDCGTPPTAIPELRSGISIEERDDRPAKPQFASMSRMRGDTACEQSSIQLRVANGTSAAATISIRKVEVLDDTGALVGELASRSPSRWANDAYQPWDEQLAPADVLQVSYALSAPNVARGESYTVRVTIATADGERTLEQRTTLEAEASLPPGAVT
jgi:hypothetical protein